MGDDELPRGSVRVRAGIGAMVGHERRPPTGSCLHSAVYGHVCTVGQWRASGLCRQCVATRPLRSSLYSIILAHHQQGIRSVLK